MLLTLLGYRGSGKTTVGRIVAGRLGVEFVDADALVQARAGKSIRDIFAQDGEPAFRDLESAVLADAVRWPGPRVLATGGGAVLRPENRELLKAADGYRFYLRADAATLLARIESDAATAATRPALTTLGGGLAEVEQLLAVREPLYRETMTHELDVATLSPNQVAAMVVAQVNTDSFRCFPS